MKITNLLISALVFSALLATSQASQGASLEDIAQSMQPGEWREITTNNFMSGGTNITVTGQGGSVMEFTDEAVWDPINNELYIIGVARGDGNYGLANQKWLKYSESTNTWTDISSAVNSVFYLGYHSYDHVAFDPVRRHYYVRVASADPSMGGAIWRYDLTSGQWSRMADLPSGAYLTVASAMEYFPEMDRVVYAEGGFRTLYLYNPSTNTWSDEISWGSGPDSSGNFIEYDPVNGVLYFGGSADSCCDRLLFKLDASGTVTQLASAPASMGNGGAMTQHTIDPISGRLLLHEAGGTSYEYDPGTNTWRTAGSHPLSNGGGQIAVTAQIPEYGVTISVKHDGGDGAVYLYKHSPGSGTPFVVPEAPSGLQVQ